MIAFISILFVLVLVILFTGREKGIMKICAGKPQRTNKFEAVPKYDEYIKDSVAMDFSKYTIGKIYGDSLEKEGVKNGSLVFMSRIYRVYLIFNKTRIETLIKPGSLVVFWNDASRMRKEYPDREVVNGFKIRKVVGYLDVNTSESDLKEIVKKNMNGQSNEDFEEKIYKKFLFAKDYYNKDGRLIMSLTYRNKGQDKDFSFHSISFLRGIVKYCTKDPYPPMKQVS